MASSPELNSSFNYSHSSGLDSLLRKVLIDNPQVACIDPCSQVVDGEDSNTRLYTPKKQQSPNIRYNKDLAMFSHNGSPLGPIESPSKGRIIKSERLEKLMQKLDLQDNEHFNGISEISQITDLSRSLNSSNFSADIGLFCEDTLTFFNEGFSPLKRTTLRRSLKSFKKKVTSPFKRSDSLKRL